MWEYKSIYLNRDDYIKGWVGKSYKPDILDKKLNEYGADGWEMIGVAFNDGAGGNAVIVFKRQK